MSVHFAIEGIKGAGKSTVLQSALTRLRELSNGVVFHRPIAPLPYWAPWEVLGRLIKYGGLTSLDEYLYAARANSNGRTISNCSAPIISDRSIYTSLVTRWPADDSQVSKYVDRVLNLEKHNPIPDTVLYLDVAIETSLQRISGRPRRAYGTTDEHAESLLRAKMLYDKIRLAPPHESLKKTEWVIVDANESAAALSSTVFEIIVQKIEANTNAILCI